MPERCDYKLVRQVTDKLRKIRKDRKLSQAIVTEDTGIHIGRIESRDTNLTITAIGILCKYYEISLGKFFEDIDGSDDMI